MSKLNAKLLVVGGDAKVSEIQLRLPTVIGRGREASLTLPHPLVSRRHTEIFEQDGRLMVRDLGSLNGTFVNNQRIEDAQVLEPNQLLTLGNVTFRAVYDLAKVPDQDQISVAQVIDLSESVAAASHEEDTEATPDNNMTGPLETGSSREAPVALDGNVSDSKRPVDKTPSAVDDSVSALADLGEAFSQGSVSSLSISRLSGLPEQASSVVELDDVLDFGDQPQASSAIDPSDFEFDGAVKRSSNDPSQSDLGSFIKKLPR